MTILLEGTCAWCTEAFDWPPILADDEEYCCEACSRQEECSCPEHRRLDGGFELGWRTGSSVLVATAGEL